MAKLISRSRGLTKLDVAAVAASVAIAGSGVLHLYQAPMHLDHSWEHGTILATVGVVDLAWVIAWMRSRGTWLLYAGVFLPAVTVALYAISRFLPLPLEGKPEEITALNFGTQLFEVAGLALLLGVAAMLHRKALTIAITLVLAFAAAWAFYGAALWVAAITT